MKEAKDSVGNVYLFTYYLQDKKFIERVEKAYSVKFVVKIEGGWLFYQHNPDTNKGHSNWMFLYYDRIYKEFYVTNGANHSCNNKFKGVLIPNTNEILVSWDRHDYVLKNGCMIDGGQLSGYIRRGGEGKVCYLSYVPEDDSWLVSFP